MSPYPIAFSAGMHLETGRLTTPNSQTIGLMDKILQEYVDIYTT